MICKDCGNELNENEFICERCLNILDISNYKKQVQERAAKIRLKNKKQKVKENTLVCNMCGKNFDISKGFCEHCFNIIDEKLFEISRQEILAEIKREQEKQEIYKNSRYLRWLCTGIPFLGLIMYALYFKKNRILANMCLNSWSNGFYKIRLLIILLLFYVYSSIKNII